MPRFKAAVRAVLLAAHRGSQGAGPASRQATLGSLPQEVLQHIFGQAAHPMANWIPPPRG